MRRSVLLSSALLVSLSSVGFAPTTKPSINVILDTTQAPDLAQWAEETKARCIEWYPRLCEDLDSPGFTPPTEVKIIIRPMDGVAHAANGEIHISAEYVRKFPKDIGMPIHELVHIIQKYPHYNLGWLVEGIADYERLYVFEPDAPRPRVDPVKSKYTDAYKTTAAFLDYLVREVDPQIIKKLNTRLRNSRVRESVFKELTGQDVKALWAKYVATLAKPAVRPSGATTKKAP